MTGPFVPSSAWLLLGGLGGICCPPDPPISFLPGPGPPTAGDIEREEDDPVGEGVGLRPLGVTDRGSFFWAPSSVEDSLADGVDDGEDVGPGF